MSQGYVQKLREKQILRLLASWKHSREQELRLQQLQAAAMVRAARAKRQHLRDRLKAERAMTMGEILHRRKMESGHTCHW
eukprot:5104136-Amphidinium_carterae.1